MFSTLLKRESVILSMLYLLSANALNLVMSEILSFGKELITWQNFGLIQMERIFLSILNADQMIEFLKSTGKGENAGL